MSSHICMYGLLVVALSNAFFDMRLAYLTSDKLFERLEHFACIAKDLFDVQHARYTELDRTI